VAAGDGDGEDLDVDADVACLRLGAADRGDLRVGEHHLRDRPVVGPPLAVLAGDDVADQAGLVLTLVGEQRSSVDVAGGVQPAAVDPGDAQPVSSMPSSRVSLTGLSVPSRRAR
jgi:hypothetical protein